MISRKPVQARKIDRGCTLTVRYTCLYATNVRSTRDRIISAAAKLFYEEGIGRVSIDAIAGRVGVTKRTLYYHFASKDELVAAYLEGRDQPNLTLFAKWFDETEGDLADKIQGIFSNLERSARHPKWRGCGFLRTSVELVGTPGHPAIEIGTRHKKKFEYFLQGVLESGGVRDPLGVARQISILLDGSFAVVLLHRDPSYMKNAGAAAHTLVSAALK